METKESIRLKDGRKLGYAEFGDPDGKPVLEFHGFPGSRFEGSRKILHKIAEHLHARVFVLERPGFGISDFQPGRALFDWPKDVREFVDQKRIKEFSIIGYSAGGPHAAACAVKMPERINRTVIVSGLGPMNGYKAFDGMKLSERATYILGHRAPWLLKFVYQQVNLIFQKDPKTNLAQYSLSLCEADRIALAESDIQEMVGRTTLEAFRNGPKGVAWDNRILSRNWGFSLEDINTPVYLFHGEADNIVPAAHSHYLTRKIRSSNAKFFPGEGHFSLINHHFEEILSTALG